jgi:hypothetical protein
MNLIGRSITASIYPNIVRNYQESMKAPLEAAGFRLVLIRRDNIGEYKNQGAKPVYVTDKKKWRREVQKAELILFAKPG